MKSDQQLTVVLCAFVTQTTKIKSQREIITQIITVNSHLILFIINKFNIRGK